MAVPSVRVTMPQRSKRVKRLFPVRVVSEPRLMPRCPRILKPLRHWTLTGEHACDQNVSHRGSMMTILVGLFAASLVPGIAVASGAPQMPMIAQAKTDQATPKVVDARLLTVRGTVEAIDKDKQTVTLKGPNRSLTL